jgi:hypothetical protein
VRWLNDWLGVRTFFMTQNSTIKWRGIRERKARFHRKLVILQLMVLGVLVCVLGWLGLGKWAFACWLLAVTLMFFSMAVQVWWRAQDSSGIQPAYTETSFSVVAESTRNSLLGG